MQITYQDIWIAAGVLIGFQIYSFAWRISREVKVGEQKDNTWLPPAEILNLISMVVASLGVFALPILELVNYQFMKYSFGLAVILFVGYPFVLAGHYDLYNRKTKRSFKYFPKQEKVAVLIVCVFVILYLTLAIF
ncbi:hypothetical protein ACFLQZ_03920 [Acidobacteriota bacterium]